MKDVKTGLNANSLGSERERERERGRERDIVRSGERGLCGKCGVCGER